MSRSGLNVVGQCHSTWSRSANPPPRAVAETPNQKLVWESKSGLSRLDKVIMYMYNPCAAIEEILMTGLVSCRNDCWLHVPGSVIGELAGWLACVGSNVLDAT